MLRMTTPHERTRAVLETRAFLAELMDSSMHPDMPEVVRLEARRLLRHYPSASDMKLAGHALPLQFCAVELGAAASQTFRSA